MIGGKETKIILPMDVEAHRIAEDTLKLYLVDCQFASLSLSSFT